MHHIGTIAMAGMLVAGTATGLAAADRSVRFSTPHVSSGPHVGWVDDRMAEPDDLRGTIVNIDTMAHTITFADGRIVHYDPMWRILVNGREVAITEVAPGAVIATAPATTTTTTTTRVVTPGTPQPAMATAPGAVAHPPIVATGTVMRVDPAARTMTLQDGRTVALADNQVWQAIPLDRILPGTQVTVTGPVPAGVGPPVTQPGAVTNPPIKAIGTAGRVDSSARTITFQDGRTVSVASGQAWQAVPLDRIVPGTQVTVTNVVPAGTVREGRFAPAPPPPTAALPARPEESAKAKAVAPAWVWRDREVTGRVAVVEPQGSKIVLADGTTILVTPSTSVTTANARTVTVNELRPGDEVVVQVQQVVPVVDYRGDELMMPRRARVETRSRTVRTDVTPAARTEVTPPATVTTRVTTTDRQVEVPPHFLVPTEARVIADRVVLVRRSQAP